MSDTSIEKLFRAVQEAQSLYYRLVLLVGPTGTKRTTIIKAIAEKLNCKPINLNLELSKRLLEMTNRERALTINQNLDDILSHAQECAVLEFTEILFDVSLKSDPLALLKRMSRNRTIVASWTGFHENGKLVYAEPGHPEHRTYDASEIKIVKIENDLWAEP